MMLFLLKRRESFREIRFEKKEWGVSGFLPSAAKLGVGIQENLLPNRKSEITKSKISEWSQE